MDEITIESIRAELAEWEAAHEALPEFVDDETTEQRERFKKADFELEWDLVPKLHLLLDTIDKWQKAYENDV